MVLYGWKICLSVKRIFMDYLEKNMPNPDNADKEARRIQFDSYLSQLNHWK